MGLLAGAMAPDRDAVLSAFLRAATDVPDHSVFVLDDYHLIDDPSDNSATSLVTAEAARRELALLYPNGGETIRQGRLAAVQWTMRGVEGGVRVEISGDNGQTWTRLAEDTANIGFFDWVPPAGEMPRALVRVTSTAEPALSATSARSFEIR